MPGENRRHELIHRDGQEETFITTHLVDDSHDGWRVDVFLKTKLKRKSRNFIQTAIDDGRILLNPRSLGQTPRLKPSTTLQIGDEVQVITDKRHPEPAVDFGYQVLFEDDHILVIDKPGNLPVHPAGRFFFNTLLSRLRTDRKESYEQGDDFYLVHRIDRETSGVLLIGKSSATAGNLVAQFRKHQVRKKYLALCYGVIEQDEFVVDKSMSNDPVSSVRLKMAVCSDGEGLTAYTAFRVLERSRRFTLVEAMPRTGRQHQIRVHLASCGHPVVGDKLYAGIDGVFLSYLNHAMVTPEMSEALILKRHGLHACELSFFHPHDGTPVTVKSPLPEEIAQLLREDR